MYQLLCIDCKYFKIITEHVKEYDYTKSGCTCIYRNDSIIPNFHGYSPACSSFKVKDDYSNETERPEYLRY